MSYALVMGVDPSQRRSAIAWGFGVGGDWLVGREVLGPIELLGEWDVLERLAKGCDGRLLAVIECPTWDGRGTKEVRSAAIAFERELQRLFPDRSVRKVDPNAWQKCLLDRTPFQLPKKAKLTSREELLHRKQRSLWYCRHVARVDVGEDTDLADAVCILEYAKLIAKGLI